METTSEVIFPRRLLGLLLALAVVHQVRSSDPLQMFNTSDDAKALQQEQRRQEEDDLKFALEETKKRREVLDQLLTRQPDSPEDLETMLEALEEYTAALDYLNRHGKGPGNVWKQSEVRQGYISAGKALGRLLDITVEEKHQIDAGAATESSTQVQHGEILEGPVKKLRLQIEKCSDKQFRTEVENTFSMQADHATRTIRRKRMSQLLKAGIVLKRALPESPMIAISSILSIYSGTLDSARLYLRGEMLTRAISLATGTAETAAGGSKSRSLFSLKNLVLLEIMAAVVSVLKERAQTIGKRRFVQNLKTDLFASMVGQDTVYFEKTDLWEVRHLIGNADYVCTALLSTPTTTLESFARVASAAVLLARQSPNLAAFVFLIALPLKSYLNAWLDELSNHIEQAKASLFVPNKSFADIWQTLVDPKALRTMRAFAREPQEIEDFSRSVRAKDAQDESSALAYQLITPARDALDKLLDVFGVWYGGRLVGEKSMRAADLPSFVSLCADTFERAKYLYNSVGQFGVDVLEPVEKMHDLLTSKPRIGLYVPPYPNEGGGLLDFSIEFKDVRFAYPTRPQAEILRGVTFKINRGEKIGIMGESGCGKSTLFALLERLYEPTAGEIYVGGKLLQDHNPLFLREHIAWVSQQSFMAKRTVKENLLYGRKRKSLGGKKARGGGKDDEGDEKTMQDIRKALDLAQCSFFVTDTVRFPDGLLTDIGPNASKLSGGEVQRLALARALLCEPKPKLLLLDEYTSALDETSQRNVQLAIDSIWREAQGDLTILSIAHRISNFKNVDKVIAMSKDGRVAEIGPPKELLQAHPNGIFATFVKTSEVDFSH